MHIITTVRIDLAKNVFHAVGHDAQGREKMKKRLSRPAGTEALCESAALSGWYGGLCRGPLLCA